MEDAQANERFREMLRLLLEKSKASKVKWEQAAERQFSAKFPPDASVTSGFIEPRSDPDFYFASLTRGHLRIFNLVATQDEDDWDLLRSLYAEAERVGVDWEGALGQVEQALKTGRGA